MSLYRVAQEALTNVMKHAPGAPTAVALVFGPAEVTLRVENGAGAGLTALASSGGGYGLPGIAERVALLGGHVEAGPTSGSGGGWLVEAVVPLTSAVEEEVVSS